MKTLYLLTVTTSCALLDAIKVMWQVTNVTLRCLLHLLHPLSLLQSKDGLDKLCVENSRLLFTYQDSRTPLMKSYCPPLPVDCVQKGQTFSTVHLLQLTGPRMFILPLRTKKCYFIGWHSLSREGCVASVTQPLLGLVILVESDFVTDVCMCLQLCIAMYV